jgi:hypothetical protein
MTKEKVLTAIRNILAWIKLWLWTKPVSKPPKAEPIRTKGEQVFDNYMVIHYHGQRINVEKTIEYPAWKFSSRADKRATAERYRVLEKKGYIRFEEINGKLICLKNKNYQEMADKKKEVKQ